MKKTYIAPEIIVTELDGDTLMLTISAGNEETGLQGTTYGGMQSGGDADAQGRRGSWGNLWD